MASTTKKYGRPFYLAIINLAHKKSTNSIHTIFSPCKQLLKDAKQSEIADSLLLSPIVGDIYTCITTLPRILWFIGGALSIVNMVITQQERYKTCSISEPDFNITHSCNVRGHKVRRALIAQ